MGAQQLAPCKHELRHCQPRHVGACLMSRWARTMQTRLDQRSCNDSVTMQCSRCSMCAADTLHRHLHRASVAEARRRQHSMTRRAPPGASCWTYPARRSCLRTRPPGRRRVRPPSWHQPQSAAAAAVPPPCRRRRKQQRQSLRQTPPRQTAGRCFWSTWRPAAYSTAPTRSMQWQRRTVPLAHLRAFRRVSLGKFHIRNPH